MKLSEMNQVKAKKVLEAVLPLLQQMQHTALINEQKGALQRGEISTMDFLANSCTVIMQDAGVQDGIVAAMTGKTIAEVKQMPFGEYLDAMRDFSPKDFADFFGLWVTMASLL